jgi:perosamine synthetase
MSHLLFSHARVALKYGLISLNLGPKDSILVPDFICDEVLQPLRLLGISFIFYSLNDDLTPNWEHLKKQVKDHTKAIIMVHYFGQPQNINNFQNFCYKNNLFLIEDNAHGFGGLFNGKKLGLFGDIGIGSPRKILNLPSGGQLALNNIENSKIDEIISLLPRYKISKPQIFLSVLLNKSHFIKSHLKKFFIKQPKYWEPMEFKESLVIEHRVDLFSEKKLKTTNINSVIKKRRELYFIWEEFALRKGLSPVFSCLDDWAVPLVFPAYVSSSRERRGWFNWGWENRYNVHSWPTLPESVIQENKSGFAQWSKLICFPIDLNMDIDFLKNRLSKL